MKAGAIIFTSGQTVSFLDVQKAAVGPVQCTASKVAQLDAAVIDSDS